MKKTKIVIAGGGFAGLYAARYFDKGLAYRADLEVNADQSLPDICIPVTSLIRSDPFFIT